MSGAILAGPRDLLDGMYHTRRMFGAGLPGAWPFAAVAMHYLPGFVDRFRDAVGVSEAFIEQVARHDAFTVERMTAGTNLFRLRVAGTDPGAFRRRLRNRGVDLGGMRPDGSVLVGVNETCNRATADDLADRLVASGRARAEQFSMRRLADRYLEAYAEVVGERTAARIG